MKKLSIPPYLFVWIVVFTHATAFSQNQAQQGIAPILSTLYNGDVEELNTKYIHPTYGLHDLYRVGATDRIRVLFAIPDEETKDSFTLYQQLFSSDKTTTFSFQWKKVSFSCDNFSWNQEGVFLSEEKVQPSPLNLIQGQDNRKDSNFTKEEYTKAAFIEEHSIKVIDTENDLILYCTKIEGKWYLTVVDRLTTDCSA